LQSFLFFLVKCGFYDLIEYFLRFWVFDYGGVNIGLLYGVGFSEGGWFSAFFLYDERYFCLF